MKMILYIVLILYSSMLAEQKIKVGIDEQLGKQIPLNLTYTDEQGNKVVLKDLMNKPTLFTFVYYDCPGICTPLLNSLTEVINISDLVPGKDYNVISLSFDETDSPALALRKKNNYLEMITKSFPPEAWRFLTGDSVEIKKLTDAAGFYYMREGKEFIHSGAFIFVTPEGKITRYLFPGYSERAGFNILPFDFKMAIHETEEGKVAPTIARVLQFCFSYDPDGKTYVFNITRVLGAGMLLAVIGFVIFLTVKPKKSNPKEKQSI
jgi:protein SCO1